MIETTVLNEERILQIFFHGTVTKYLYKQSVKTFYVKSFL